MIDVLRCNTVIFRMGGPARKQQFLNQQGGKPQSGLIGNRVYFSDEEEDFFDEDEDF